MTNANTITCSLCGSDPGAPCAGNPNCHGFYEGCDCERCQREHRHCRKVARTGEGSMPVMPSRIKPL